MNENTATSERLESECQAHWKHLGLNSPEDVQAYIQAIFDSCESQSEVISALYELLFPAWDNIDKINGYPIVGEEFWLFVSRRFIDFDRIHHPRVMPGGAWMNVGFASDKSLAPWEISFTGCNAELIALAS
ncbi:hypothetical protein SAMN02745216_02140 [Desulfatibacillum alkenivorans DSM 16219]|jgi:hypothetical protein|uniref:Uncharacterized protein n=1 Tax=Desulfatibacillum alkenivorans DSM 16219 TaxID=1121393 RepID=A0A1M6LNU2_9BACT|nr:hypothetical protein [Desulfatibacillum alkenivorans]SHJ72887.1 hypothetical protein SAMN02745216_02140 [Desulfatibacillum alkenivorans DSM 16219]